MPHFRVSNSHRKNAQNMRRSLTEAELKLWNAVRAHRLMGLSFRRQMPIGGYIVDFACPEHKLIIEVDGASHSYDRAINRDLLRDQKLASLGWQVVRFTNDEVYGHIDDVCLHILSIIGIQRFK